MSLRKIESKEKKSERDKRIKTIGSIFLVAIMLLSTAGYALWGSDSNDNTNEFEYGTYRFIRSGSFWELSLEDNKYYFRNLPNETRGLMLEDVNYLDYSDKPLYFIGTTDSIELIIANFGGLIQRYQEACISNLECNENLPMKSCTTDNLLIFLPSNKTEVKKVDKCVYFYGDFSKGIDAFSYSLLGIE